MDTLPELYSYNSPARFWRLAAEPQVSPAEWNEAIDAAASLLPEAARVLGTDGNALMYAVLGEGQFGPGHWQLGAAKRLYYALQPVLPRALVLAWRRLYRFNQRDEYGFGWPVEERYVRFQFQVVQNILDRRGETCLPFIHFWPHDARYAFVLPPDVERERGQSFVRDLAALEEEHGFRSSFNFVPEVYRLDRDLMAELRERGFEVGVHGLKHDGKLFSSRSEFERRATRINQALRDLGAVGYRSPLMHRNPDWMQSLDIEYDVSFFDTDPYEPMPGGTMSIWPFFLGHFVELPYTLVQDHTLMVILREQTPRLWLEKVDYIRQFNGMALLCSHPDYLRDPNYLAIYEEFLQEMHVRKGFWHALPCEVARWWCARAETTMELQNGQWGASNLPDASVGYLERSS